MTQGYGPEHGQQGQWGQNPPPAAPPQQDQQWGSPQQPSPAPQPQWGPQPSPGPAPQPGSPAPAAWGQGSATPGGYPGAAGASAAAQGPSAAGPRSTLSKIIQAMFFTAIGLVVLRLISNIIVNVGGFASVAAGSTTAVGVTGLFLLASLALNILVSLVVLGLAVVVIIQARDRGRTGAIIVVAALILGLIVYWVLQILSTVLTAALADPGAAGFVALFILIAEIIRALIVFAALIVGASMSRGWAKYNA